MTIQFRSQYENGMIICYTCYGSLSISLFIIIRFTVQLPTLGHKKPLFKHIIFTKTQKLGMSDCLFRPSAVYEVKAVVCYIKI